MSESALAGSCSRRPRWPRLLAFGLLVRTDGNRPEETPHPPTCCPLQRPARPDIEQTQLAHTPTTPVSHRPTVPRAVPAQHVFHEIKAGGSACYHRNARLRRGSDTHDGSTAWEGRGELLAPSQDRSAHGMQDAHASCATAWARLGKVGLEASQGCSDWSPPA